jgi:serine/threonine protein kinase/Flp pilus assembly protein TadD
MATLDQRRTTVEEVAEDYLARLRRGERPHFSEYTTVYPDLAEEIRDIFPSLLVMEEARPPQGLPGPGSRPVTVDGRPLERLNDYRIIREIGHGGMGIVYEAEQESLGRRVALKVLPFDASMDPKCLLRFRREARSAGRLHHTNIVPVFDVGHCEGVHYYAMQFIQGQPLDQVIAELRRMRATNRSENAARPPNASVAKSSPGSAESLAENLLSGEFRRAELGDTEQSGGGVPWAVVSEREGLAILPREQRTQLGDSSRPTASIWSALVSRSSRLSSQSDFHYYLSVARIGLQVAAALEYAHSQNVLHRDIKPANLLLDARGTVWVTDFGLAKEDGDYLTKTGDVVGTLRYMAPERFKGESTPRSDIYSLGLMLYELLSLRPAFDEVDRARFMWRVAHEEPPAPRVHDPHVPRDLETIVMTAIAKEQLERYSTAKDLVEDLRRFLADRPIQSRRVSRRERLWRLCRRNPALAGLIVALALTFFAGFAGVTWKWREAGQAREDERVARNREHVALELAENRAEELRQGLDRLKAANALLDRGRWYGNELRWDDAHAAFTKAIALRPDHAAVWVERGDLYTRLGLWDLAAADYAQEMESREPDTALRWFQHALLRLYVGDVEGYRKTCRRMRERFRGTLQPRFAEEVVRSQLLASNPDADLPRLQKTLQEIVTHQPWSSLYILGMAHYRAGEHEQAIQRLNEGLAVHGRWPLSSLSYPVLAMAHYRQGRIVEARQALYETARVLDQWTNDRYENQTANWVVHQGANANWPLPWWDYLEGQLHYREAKVLIDGTEPPDDPRLHVLRARAFSGLRWSEKADKEFDVALKLDPRDARIRLEAYRSRGYYYVHRRRWSDAAAEFAKASEIQPDDSYLWRFRAVACFTAGDVDTYRRTCAEMLDRFEETQDNLTAGNVLLACVLQDDALSDMARLLPLTKVADSLWHWGSWVRGAALYRARKYTEAVDCFETAADNYQPRAWDWCFLAMAHCRLGHAQDASRCLAEAARWIDEANRQEMDDLSGTRPAWGDWHEPIVYSLLLHEAQALVHGAGRNDELVTP